MKWVNKKKEFFKFLEDRGYEIACVRCGKKSGLVFHHIHYDNVGDETIEDVLLLCHGCHSFWHRLVKKFTPEEKFNPEAKLAEFISNYKWAKKSVKYKKV